MAGHDPDVKLVRKHSFFPEVLFGEEFHESLGGGVDHHVGDDASLSQSYSEAESREDVAIVALGEVDDLSLVEEAGEGTPTREDSSTICAPHGSLSSTLRMAA